MTPRAGAARAMLAAATSWWAPLGAGCAAQPPVSATVTVDTATRFQTITGWEATAQAGHEDPGYARWRDTLLGLAVNDLGINRLRLHLRSGVENPRDYYAEMRAGHSQNWRCERWLTVNDNADPNTIDWRGFHFSELDEVVDKIVLPMRRLLEARGERLFFNLNYVAFVRQCGHPIAYVHDQPAEYAELILATFLHLRQQYGFVPDAVEVILEPDNTPVWRGELIGRAIAAAGPRLAAAGFRPQFIAPSNTHMGRAVGYFDALVRVPGALPYLGELSYHRYGGVSDANLDSLAERAARYGIRTAMLEHIGSGADDLYHDLALARVSAWQQFALAYAARDDGAQYYVIDSGRVRLGDRTRYLRQYFHYVRFGAQVVGAGSDRASVRPLAFVTRHGLTAVVIQVDQGTDVNLRGLRPGAYGASITTERDTGAELGALTAGPDGTLRVTAPAAGVLTVYSR